MHATGHFLEPIFSVFKTESVTVPDNFYNPHFIYPTVLGSLNPRIGGLAAAATIRNLLLQDALREPIT